MKRIFPFLFFSFFSCNGDIGSIPDLFGDEKFDDLYTLVYVDLSTSQDSISVRNTIEKVVTIYKNQPNQFNAQFIVRVIDKDHSIQPLIDVEQRGSVDGRDDIVDERSKFRDSCSGVIEREIFHYYHEKTPRRKSSKESCICNSLENAHNSLAYIDTSKTTIRLVVFSDMFEECGDESSYFDEEFYLCKKKGIIKSAEELKNDVIEHYEPDHLISEYVKPENLYFIISQGEDYTDDPDRCLKAREVEAIWGELFIKFGYSRDDLRKHDGIVYSPDIPERLTNHE